MNRFLGRFEFQMDEKGRVSLPSAFRRESEDTRFVLVQWERPYLSLFPESTWDGTVRERLMEYRRRGGMESAHVRRITSTAVEVSPDKQGRILIPAWLQEAGSLDTQTLVIGALDRIEIWNPALYESAMGSTDDTFDEVAHRIFG